jgi:hypothetical protein
MPSLWRFINRQTGLSVGVDWFDGPDVTAEAPFQVSVQSSKLKPLNLNGGSSRRDVISCDVAELRNQTGC